MKKQGYKCVLCGKWKLGWGPNKQYGNNPSPLANHGECCDECNKLVVLTRIKMMTGKAD